MAGLSDHLKVGVQTLSAFLAGKNGKLVQAEQALNPAREEIKALATDFPGVEYLRQRVLLIRVFYLCHARDSRKILAVTAQLDVAHREEADVMHARAAIEVKELNVAKGLLKKHMHHSETAKRLFMILASEMAIKAIEKEKFEEARAYIEEIPAAPEEFSIVNSLLIMSEELESIDTIEEVSRTINNLNEHLNKVQDDKLIHSIVHNLAMLNLKLAIMVEDSMNKTEIERLWNECIDFWDEYVFSSADYWNLEQQRFSGSEADVKSFSLREVEVISRKLIAEYFTDMFSSYAMTYFRQNDEAGIERHLDLLRRLGEKSSNLKGAFSDLRQAFAEFMKHLGNAPELMETWDFSICSVIMQSKISAALELDDAQELKTRLEIFRSCKAQYPTPKEHALDQKKYNTYLFDALHLGINGDLAEANNKLRLVLSGAPPGIMSEKIIARLSALAEACKLSLEGQETGLDLKDEFESLYSLVKQKKIISDTRILQTH